MLVLLAPIVAAVAAIVLLVPVRIDLELDVSAPAKRRVRVEARWLFLAWRSGRRRRERPARPARRRRAGFGKRRRRRFLAVLRTRGFAGRAGRLIVELLRLVVPRTASGWVRFGLEDPVTTGVLFGVAHAATGLASAAAWNFRLEPEFTGPALAGQARFAWAVRPGAVLWPLGTFVASPVAWRAAVAALRTK